jgi:hypothetical protein
VVCDDSSASRAWSALLGPNETSWPDYRPGIPIALYERARLRDLVGFDAVWPWLDAGRSTGSQGVRSNTVAIYLELGCE